MSEKVKLTKEQAGIVQSLLDEGRSSVEHTLKQHVFDKNGFSGEKLLPLREMTFDTLVRAFYVGYEVEETVEEKLLYRYAVTSSFNEDFRDGYRSGVVGTLNIIGMKVKGINA